MQVVERHGGGSHFVRPDRVYRTGVLTSTMGYDPGADVQSVAASFTQYPMDLPLPEMGIEPTEPSEPAPGGNMAGLMGFGAISPIDKLRLKFSAWKARRRARKILQGLRGLHGGGLFNRSHGGLPGLPGMLVQERTSQIIAQEGDEQHDDDSREPKVFDPRHMPGGVYAQIGERYLPQELNREQLIAQLMNSNLPHALAQAQAQVSFQHWVNRWWNG
jgi:hypothetical protein